MEIFVGNLPSNATEEDLLALFQPYGEVRSAQVKRELFSGLSKGFGFVEMPGRRHSLAAIAALNGKEVGGQPLRVNEAQLPRGRGGRRR